MNRGRRYEERKLNMKKVFAVVIAIIVFIMCIFMLKGILTKDREKGKVSSKDYFSIFKDNKWGVIDEKGNIVIDPSYAEMIIVPNSKKDVFLCTYDVNYETGEYKTKVLNSKNEEIFEKYEQIEAIQNKDSYNNLWYEENILKVKKDGKYGAVNLEGKKLIETEYDEIIALEETRNILKVSKDGKYGIIDNEGKNLINPQYKEIITFDKDNKLGVIVKNEEDKYGLVDFSNKQILEIKYDEIQKVHSNDYFVIKQGEKVKLIKKNGEEVLTEGFDKISSILKNNENGIVYIKDNKYGIMKMTGEITIEAKYEQIKESKSGIFIAKKDGKYGIITLEGNKEIDFKYNNIYYNEKANMYVAEKEDYNNDVIDNEYKVRQSGILVDIDTEKGYFKISQEGEYKYYNFKFEEKKVTDIYSSNTLFLDKNNGKYGFIDKEGNVVVDYIYDDATEQNNYGFAGIKKDGKWGSIDKDGKIVQEPTYELEQYLKIDFIGRWHLGKDLNMNYYNQL